MQPQTFASKTTPITLADGKERQLRYSLGSVKRVKEKFGKTFTDILNHPPEEFIPFVLMEGLVDKTGITEESIMEDLVTGPMIESVQLSFVEAFFGEQQKRAVDALLERNRNNLAKIVQKAAEPQEATAAPPTEKVM